MPFGNEDIVAQFWNPQFDELVDHRRLCSICKYVFSDGRCGRMGVAGKNINFSCFQLRGGPPRPYETMDQAIDRAATIPPRS